MPLWSKCALIVSALIGLHACGGGGSEPTKETEKPPASYTLSGQVSGLNGTLTLAAGAEQLAVEYNGQFSFATDFNSGASVSVSIVEQPERQNCEITSASSFTFNQANISSLRIACTYTEIVITGQVLDDVGENAQISMPPYNDNIVSSSIDGNGYYEIVLDVNPSTASGIALAQTAQATTANRPALSPLEPEHEIAAQIIVQGQGEWSPITYSSRLVGFNSLISSAGADGVLDATELAQVDVSAFSTARDVQIELTSRDMPITAATMHLIGQELDLWLQLEMAAALQLLVPNYLPELAAAELTTRDVLANRIAYSNFLSLLHKDDIQQRVYDLIDDPKALGDRSWADLRGAYIAMEPSPYFLPQVDDQPNKMKFYFEDGGVLFTQNFMAGGLAPVTIENNGRLLKLPIQGSGNTGQIPTDDPRFGLTAEEIAAFEVDYYSTIIVLASEIERDIVLVGRDDTSISVLERARRITKERAFPSPTLGRDIVFKSILYASSQQAHQFGRISALRERAPVFDISETKRFLIPFTALNPSGSNIGIRDVGTLKEVTLHADGTATAAGVDVVAQWSLSADQKVLRLDVPYSQMGYPPAVLTIELFWRKYDSYAKDLVAKFSYNLGGNAGIDYQIKQAAPIVENRYPADLLVTPSDSNDIHYHVEKYSNLWDINVGMVYGNLLRVTGSNSPANAHKFGSDQRSQLFMLRCFTFDFAREPGAVIGNCADQQYTWYPTGLSATWSLVDQRIFVADGNCDIDAYNCPGSSYKVLNHNADLGTYQVQFGRHIVLGDVADPWFTDTEYSLETMIQLPATPVVNPQAGISSASKQQLEAPLANYPRLF